MADVSARRLDWTGCYAFVLIGIYVAALGPGLPSIAARTHVPLAQAGTLVTAIFAGGLLASGAAGHRMDRAGRRPLLVSGALLNGLGCLLLSLARAWWQALAAGVLMGVGDSTVIVGCHVVFTDIHPRAAGAALNRLNVFFGLGALAGPALAGLSLLATGSIALTLRFVACGQVLTALLLATAPFPERPPLASQAHERRRFREQGRLLPMLALVIFVYVSLEVGLGNWAFTYLRGGGAFGVGAAALVTAAYWGALALGRALSPLALRRLSDPAFLLVAIVAATSTAALFVALAGFRPAGAGLILLLGFAFGPIWPLTFAVSARAFQQSTGAVSGLLATAGSVGGLAGPWLQGVLLLQHGAHWGMAYTLTGCGAILIFYLLAYRGLVRQGMTSLASAR